MTVKQFFKSNAFKCIAVLMGIVIVCGGIIAVCNGLFNVSAEEAAERAMKNIFGSVPEESIPLTLPGGREKNKFGTAEEVFAVTDSGKSYLVIKAAGTGGFKGGTVTVWTVITVSSLAAENGQLVSANATGIKKVLYDSDTSQTLMANFKSSYYEQFTQHNDAVAAGKHFTADDITIIYDQTQELIKPVGGATYSSTAIINAVNAALCVAYGGGGV